ncbi:MAG: aldose 1-epimerase [Bryobacterales bacterium]|jgi:aldose 1-epimerase|nr:aldose 1-epimerase [Bryobacterales bacterium]
MANFIADTVTQDGVELLRLRDVARELQVLIAPSAGANALEFSLRGKNYMYTGGLSPLEVQQRKRLCGNPLLAPWANRLLPSSFPANGRTYVLQEGIGNLRKDGNGLPIHGLVAFTDAWGLMNLEAFDNRAEATCRLEFWRYPEWMAQWPFAHSLYLTYRLRDGALEVETIIENYAREAMPVAIGYHPYFQLPGVPREQWFATLPARKKTVLSDKLTPTGQTEPFSPSEPLSLKDQVLDNIFEDLVRDDARMATFSVSGGGRRLSVVYGPQYPVAVVYAPRGQEFICFEPMTGVTNQLNLAAEGKYPPLPEAPAHGVWKESYWIRIE